MKIGGQNISFGARREYLISVMFHFSNNFEHRSLFKANFEHLRSKWLFQHLKVFIGHSLEHYFALKKNNVKLDQRYSTPNLNSCYSFSCLFSRKRTHSRKTSMKVSLFYYLKTLSSTWCNFFSNPPPQTGF